MSRASTGGRSNDREPTARKPHGGGRQNDLVIGFLKLNQCINVMYHGKAVVKRKFSFVGVHEIQDKADAVGSLGLGDRFEACRRAIGGSISRTNFSPLLIGGRSATFEY